MAAPDRYRLGLEASGLVWPDCYRLYQQRHMLPTSGLGEPYKAGDGDGGLGPLFHAC